MISFSGEIIKFQIKNFAIHYPHADIQSNNFAHWLLRTDERQRCKNSKCDFLTSIMHVNNKIYKLNLCFQQNRNLFKEFHI